MVDVLLPVPVVGQSRPDDFATVPRFAAAQEDEQSILTELTAAENARETAGTACRTQEEEVNRSREYLAGLRVEAGNAQNTLENQETQRIGLTARCAELERELKAIEDRRELTQHEMERLTNALGTLFEEIAREQEALDVEHLADALEEVEPEFQAALVETMPDERVADVLEEMSPDAAADLLAELPEERSEDLLNLMEKEDAADVRMLLSYPIDTAGGLMNTEYIHLHENATVDDAVFVRPDGMHFEYHRPPAPEA